MPSGYKKDGTFAGKVYQKGNRPSIKTEFKKGDKPIAGFKKGSKPWNTGKHHSDITKKKISKTKTGIPATKEWKEKMKKYIKKNGGYWMGKKRPNLTGKLNPQWKGGISRNKYSLGSPKCKKWRSDVFARDNWTCQTCGARGTALQAHHIKSWANYPELRYVLENGVTLCVDCHKLTYNYKGKNKNKK